MLIFLLLCWLLPTILGLIVLNIRMWKYVHYVKDLFWIPSGINKTIDDYCDTTEYEICYAFTYVPVLNIFVAIVGAVILLTVGLYNFLEIKKVIKTIGNFKIK